MKILEEILKLERLSEHEFIEVEDILKLLKDPEKYKKDLELFTEDNSEKMKERISNMKDEDYMENLYKNFNKEKMSMPDEDLKLNFNCNDCQKRQNIHPGLVRVVENKDYSFENEIMCKYCKKNN